jgi:hypothetical protein
MATSKKHSSQRTKGTDIATVVGIILFFGALAVGIGMICYVLGEFFEALIKL